ncbi:MAG: hypothetical protein KDB00_03565 [Planctomycetales bacterium]|nr:hypothetical protein [Planctomycetales bacterium]
MYRFFRQLFLRFCHRVDVKFAVNALAIAWCFCIFPATVAAHDSAVPHAHPHAQGETPESGFMMIALAISLVVLCWIAVRRYRLTANGTH